nr:MAG TPA: hypothetical protein [Caudoviricetes sp.]
MIMEIVSGRTGKPHVTSQQFRQLIEGTVGQESCILTSGENLEPKLASNNSLKIRSGMLAHHGNISSVKIGTYDAVNLSNGSQGMKRIDLVVCRYTRNAETEVESCNWVVIMGTPVSSNPVAPTYTVGNLQEGDLVDDCPVFEVHYDGINVTEVKKILSVAPNLTELNSNSIIKSGHNDNGYYRKYADGTLEMWGSKRFDNINMQTPDNWNYYCGGRVNVPLPMESKTWVSVIATAAGSCAPWISIPQNGLGTELFQAWIYSSNKSASETITIFWRCFGTWK